jgi:hypothetical protein
MHIERELYRRFGHVNEQGRAYPANFFYKRVYHPAWWGHNARHFHSKTHPNGEKTDLWVFDADEPLPEGVILFRNVLPPVWTGELAERVKAELRRRRMAIRGSARAILTRRFTGLFICGGCGYAMHYLLDGRKWVALGCHTRYWTSDIRPDCRQTKSISEKKVIEYVDVCLRRMLAETDPDAFLPQRQPQSPKLRRETLASELSQLGEKARRLIVKQAAAPESLHNLYDEELKLIAERLSILQEALRELDRDEARAFIHVTPEYAYDEIVKLTVDGFWKLPQKQQNQLLHALMGKRRFVVLNGEIVGIADAPPRHI